MNARCQRNLQRAIFTKRLYRDAPVTLLRKDAGDFRPVHIPAQRSRPPSSREGDASDLAGEADREAWLSASAEEMEAMQARVLPMHALEIVPEDEAAQYVGGYIK